MYLPGFVSWNEQIIIFIMFKVVQISIAMSGVATTTGIANDVSTNILIGYLHPRDILHPSHPQTL
jgi:hypothetical protein